MLINIYSSGVHSRQTYYEFSIPEPSLAYRNETSKGLALLKFISVNSYKQPQMTGISPEEVYNVSDNTHFAAGFLHTFYAPLQQLVRDQVAEQEMPIQED